MARFPHYKKNIVQLGKVIARARVDAQFRQKLIDNPARELAVVGLPESVQHLIAFKVIDAAKDNVIALPFRLNQKKLDDKDPEYLSAIAREFSTIN